MDRESRCRLQSLNGEEVENIGYVVPVTVVGIPEDIRRKTMCYTGFCALGFTALENESFRRFLGTADGC